MKETYITHLGMTTNKSNLRLMQNKGITVLVSYETPVAFRDDTDASRCTEWLFTSRKYSPTTSKQITCFLGSQGSSRDVSYEVGQHHIDSAHANVVYGHNNCLYSEYPYFDKDGLFTTEVVNG